MKRKIKLTFPKDRTGQPVVSELIRDYKLDFSILNAQITEGMRGEMSMELDGAAGDIERGIAFLKQQGIRVRDIDRSIVWDAEKCTCCGCCTAVCPTAALSMGDNAELTFNSELCVVCEQCILTCPIRTLHVNYDV